MSSVDTAAIRALETLSEDLVMDVDPGSMGIEGFVQRGMSIKAKTMSPEEFERMREGETAVQPGVGVIHLSTQETAPLMLRNLAATFEDSGLNVGFMSHPTPEFLAQFGSPSLPTMVAIFPSPGLRMQFLLHGMVFFHEGPIV